LSRDYKENVKNNSSQTAASFQSLDFRLKKKREGDCEMQKIILLLLLVLVLTETAIAADSVVIIGGWGSTHDQLEYLQKNLSNSIAVVPNKYWPISEAAKDVLQQLKRKNMDARLILVGHSWGGLIAREIDRQHPGLLRKIIVIGTPNGGYRLTPRFIYGVADSTSTTPLYVIAAYNSDRKKWYMKSEKNDGSVDLDSALDLGKRKIQDLAIFKNTGHVELIRSHEVARQIKFWISQ
jgi:pimeloyl-ACP methyl ester carboxylesterase